MPNRTLALDVGGGTLRAVLLERTLRSHRVLGFYAAPRPSNGDLAADLRALTTAHGLEWDEVVSALPGHLCTHRILTLPFQDRKRLDRTVPFELEGHVPFELDDAIVDYQVLGANGEGTVVLAALARKASVEEHLAALAAAGIDPRVIDLAPLAALNLVRLASEGLTGTTAVVLLDAARTTIAVLDDRRLLGLRTLDEGLGTADDAERIIRDVRWSVLALAGDAAQGPLTVWAGGDAASGAAVTALEGALGVTPRGIADLAVTGVPVTLRRTQGAFAAPLGLALRESGTDAFGVDFRRQEFAYHREREAVWRALAGTGALALVALVLMLASFLVEGRRLDARRAALHGEIRTLFAAALPETRTIVNEKAQLTAAITALEKSRQSFGGLAPSAPRAIDLLRALTVGVPSDVALDLEELALDGETVRIRGSTRAYEDVEAVKRGLAAQPLFRDVQAKDVRASVDGQRVDFRLALTIAAGTVP